MQSNNHHESTIDDVLEAVNKFATTNEQRLGRIESDIKVMKATITTLATKDFVSKEIAKLRGDNIASLRKEDKKLGELVDVLHEKNVIDEQDVKRVVGMEPFAQLSV